MPLPSPYRNPGRWRAVVFQREVRHGTAGCLLSGVLVAPILIRVCGWGLGRVVTGVALYCLVLVPAVTSYYSAPRLLLRVLKALLALPTLLAPHHAARCVGWCASCLQGIGHLALHVVQGTGNLALQLAQGTARLVLQLALGLLQVALLPYTLTCRGLPVLHRAYVSLRGLSTIVNQAVFFLMVEGVVVPEAPLTALHTLLLYTLILYVFHALYRRQWGRGVGVGAGMGVGGLTVWWAAGRMGKGVASSCIMVLFTSLRAAQVNPNPHPVFVVATLLYFFVTSFGDTVSEWVVRAGVDEGEELWVWAALRAAPVAASTAAMAVAGASWRRPWVVAVAVYTNVAAPVAAAAAEMQGHSATRAALALRCRRPTTQEAEEGATCPVCLEGVKGGSGGRVTPCHHLFHAPCLSACLARSPLCPLCRQSIIHQ